MEENLEVQFQDETAPDARDALLRMHTLVLEHLAERGGGASGVRDQPTRNQLGVSTHGFDPGKPLELRSWHLNINGRERMCGYDEGRGLYTVRGFKPEDEEAFMHLLKRMKATRRRQD